MSAKRAAPATGGSHWKKAKTEKEKKWYAVKSGKEPGVYETWDQCQAQTTGYHGAVYKSFTRKEDAEAFVAGKKVPDRSGKPKPLRYYAVARGNYTGIFNDWSDAQDSTRGAKGPKYKRFDTLPEAVAFMREWADEETLDRIRGEYGDVSDPELSDEQEEEEEEILEPGLLRIFTDGSSLSNGRHDAVAGVGVFFGKNDPRNISERLEGPLQTNQRAELTAVLRALESIPAKVSVQILTDSKYSINCAETWCKAWEKKGWKTSEGTDVKNKDLIQAIRKKMVQRDDAKAKTVFTWVKGHANTQGNIEADRLANAGAYCAPKEAKGRTKLKTENEKPFDTESFEDAQFAALFDHPDTIGAYPTLTGALKPSKGRTKLKNEGRSDFWDPEGEPLFQVESDGEKDQGNKRRRR
ncbi:RNase h domain protein [Colletotrichum karsti]|uniref:Ribonuclease H n=1 Tax=Colletotrichum karsti TaxID=1095194 RepID=A0A9P6IDJ1_9PEZI|nr:RNase h domain protein [Colletotrichum karsti]KAF9878571.1 RNase h domain protein [Colletotrichum karsti]